MTVSFDFNFWTVAIFLISFGLNVYSINSARSRASADALEKMRRDLEHGLERHKEQTGLIFNQFAQRLQAVETEQKNAIGHDDLSAVHRRVDEMHKILGDIAKAVSRVEGILEARNK
jgi:hypothetical protein